MAAESSALPDITTVPPEGQINEETVEKPSKEESASRRNVKRRRTHSPPARGSRRRVAAGPAATAVQGPSLDERLPQEENNRGSIAEATVGETLTGSSRNVASPQFDV